MFRRALTVCAVVAGIGSALAPAASAESIPETVDFVAEDGAFPFGGQSGHWVAGPDHEVMIRESGNVLKVDADANGGFDYFALEFTGPDGASLRPGTYDHAGGAHILAISGGLGCTDDYSAFTITRIERDGEQLVALDATFEQRCSGPDHPAFRGSVHFER
ncbi:hypothetical protein [Amycolatopsis sp. NPDC059657]|uniref:hypothetical protein n=1 Tax=Amycolatopsis sp. NPDC059657 TaxID=3346899 RepID=UPI0036728EE4